MSEKITKLREEYKKVVENPESGFSDCNYDFELWLAEKIANLEAESSVCGAIRNNEFLPHLDSMIKLAQEGKRVELRLIAETPENYSASFDASEFLLRKIKEILTLTN